MFSDGRIFDLGGLITNVSEVKLQYRLVHSELHLLHR